MKQTMKATTIFCSFLFLSASGVIAWDVNRSNPQCKGVAVPGIVDTRSGSIFGKPGYKCVQRYCTCSVAASGSIIPPKVTTFSCTDEHGCEYQGLNGFGLPMRRRASKNCVAEDIKPGTC